MAECLCSAGRAITEKTSPIGRADEDEDIPRASKTAAEHARETALADHQKHSQCCQHDPDRSGKAETFLEEQPAEHCHKDRRGRDDPGSGGGFRGHQTAGLQPLVQCDAHEAQKRELKPVLPGRNGQLAMPPGKPAQDDEADQESRPDNDHRRNFTHRELGGDKGAAPHNYGSNQFQLGSENPG